MAPEAFFRIEGDALLLSLRVTPKARVERIEGLMPGEGGSVRLAVKVRAAPDKGAANRAVEELIARVFQRPRTAVCVVSGHTSRQKLVRLEGDATALAATAQQLVEEQ